MGRHKSKAVLTSMLIFWLENLTCPSIVTQTRVNDHLLVTKSSPHGFEIEGELRLSCLNASSKCKENLKEIKNAERSKNEEEKIDALLSNIKEIKHQKITKNNNTARSQCHYLL